MTENVCFFNFHREVIEWNARGSTTLEKENEKYDTFNQNKGKL
jgi:hypothetical protein